MINWAKYFDKIVCICYDKNQTRKQLLECELKRVGILDSGIFEWHITFQNSFIFNYFKMIEKYNFQIKNEYNQLLSKARISSILGHLNVIKNAYYSGCERILIIQDDVRFLKDLNKVEQVLQNIPDENQWNLILFDKLALDVITYHNLIKNKKNLVNKYYCKFISMLSAGCYCLNRQGMKVMINVHDVGAFNITDWIFCIKFLGQYWKKIFSIKSLCVQAIFNGAQTIKSKDEEQLRENILNFQKWYKNQEIDFNNYMMRKDGSPYTYGDWIEE